MHILLTDLLACPRCGIGFGLIVRADRLEERRVVEGGLGCANCRTTYPIVGGVADLRPIEGEPLAFSDTAEVDMDPGERGLRAAALIGAQPPNATVLIIGEIPDIAARVAEYLPECHLIELRPNPPEGADVKPDPRRIRSEVVAELPLPFRSATMSAVAILGRPSEGLLREAGRVLLGGGRVVVEQSGHEVVEWLQYAGFDLLLNEEGVVVAAAPKRR